MIRAPVNDEHNAKPAGAEFWHRWTVYVPRRSITGKLLWGNDGDVTTVAAGLTSASPTLTHCNRRRIDRHAAKKLVDPTDRPRHLDGAISADCCFLVGVARPGQSSESQP
jgi:hypothetical protein